jgi:hypothetical protein
MLTHSQLAHGDYNWLSPKIAKQQYLSQSWEIKL